MARKRKSQWGAHQSWVKAYKGQQQKNFSRYGGKSGNRFAKISSGNASSATGTLVIASSSEALRKTKHRFPHSCYIRFNVCVPTHFISKKAEVVIPAKPDIITAWGYQDIVYTPSSTNFKHMAWMSWDLNHPQGIWSYAATGCTLVAASAHYDEHQSPWLMNKLDDSTTASDYKAIGITMDRIPESAQAGQEFATFRNNLFLHHTHMAPQIAPVMPAPGVTPTIKSSTPDTSDMNTHIHYTGNNADQTTGAAAGSGAQYPDPVLPFPAINYYKTPNHVVSGVDIDMKFCSASVCDQWLTLKLCRIVDREPQTKITAKQQVELLNKQTVTDGRVWETVYQHSFFMPGMSTLQTSTNKFFFIKKFIKCNYARSTVRRVSQAADAPELGAMYTPTFEADDSGGMYNNLCLCVTAKMTDNHYVAVQHFKTAQSVSVPNVVGTTSDVKTIPVLTEAAKAVVGGSGSGFARFGASGHITMRFKCRDTTARELALDIALRNPEIEELPDDDVISLPSDHSDEDVDPAADLSDDPT